MRAARILSLLAILVLGLSSSALAGINAPGVYPASVGAAPGLLPPAFTPPGLPDLGPDVYRGEITVEQNADGTFSVRFDGERSDGAPLKAQAIFRSDWPGFNLGPLIVGSEQLTDAVVNIGVEYLLEAQVNGVGKVDGVMQRFLGKFGVQGEVQQLRSVPAPAIYR